VVAWRSASRVVGNDRESMIGSLQVHSEAERDGDVSCDSYRLLSSTSHAQSAKATKLTTQAVLVHSPATGILVGVSFASAIVRTVCRLVTSSTTLKPPLYGFVTHLAMIGTGMFFCT
jgi:hypothetical protein